MKKYEYNIENVIKERVNINENKNMNLLINHDEKKDNEYINNEKDSSSNKNLNLQIEENQNKFYKSKNKSQSQINIYDSEKIKRILTNENSNKKTNIKSNMSKKNSQKIIHGEKNIKKFKTLFDKKNENLNIKNKSNIETKTFKTNKMQNKNIKIVRNIQIKDISNNKEKKLLHSKKLQKNKTYFNSKTKTKFPNNNDSKKIYNVKTKIEENSNNYSHVNKSKQNLSKFDSKKKEKENKYIKIKKEMRKHSSLTLNNKTLDISENKFKEKRILSLTNNNSINKDNSYINKTINSNLTRYKKHMIKDLLLKKFYINNIKKLKKDFLKLSEKTLKKEEDKKYNNLTYLKTSTNFHKTNINTNTNNKISTSNIKHQKGKKIKLIISENNFHKNKFKDKNKKIQNKVRTTKNSKTKIIKAVNNSNNDHNKYSNFTTENSIISKNKQKKIIIKNDKIISNEKISINSNNKGFEYPFDLNFIYFFKEKDNIKKFVEKDLKKKKIKFNEIGKDYEKNINYLKSENNIEQSRIFICKIKNSSININNEFLNFVNSFYRVYI